jgi:Zn-finger protein
MKNTNRYYKHFQNASTHRVDTICSRCFSPFIACNKGNLISMRNGEMLCKKCQHKELQQLLALRDELRKRGGQGTVAELVLDLQDSMPEDRDITTPKPRTMRLQTVSNWVDDGVIKKVPYKKAV